MSFPLHKHKTMSSCEYSRAFCDKMPCARVTLLKSVDKTGFLFTDGTEFKKEENCRKTALFTQSIKTCCLKPR